MKPDLKQSELVTSREVLEAIWPVESDRPSLAWLHSKVRRKIVPFVKRIGVNYLFDVDQVRKALKEKGVIP